ncbi:hypothetical protein H4W23_39375 [Streptomyces gardneri]|uniref:hypothetical protein n=1 Tax=Streptomyces gardneri TaxID=66892 RepID=UPI0006BD68C8|nr:hypothetical protein [Streptomyces gardneri]QPK50069.1 hypothetical protein H4W23_39375 [Streptomyces gardneri]WRK41650.1 hypothetical protein U0M97_39610 [Streptomyces venezuelae]CUM35847.1 hypothetical protein BN2537_659 [Streptomyces venezuelae]
MCLFQYDDDSEPEEPGPTGPFSGSLLRSSAEPLGAGLLTVDPTLTAPAVTSPAAGPGAVRTGPATRERGHAARTA